MSENPAIATLHSAFETTATITPELMTFISSELFSWRFFAHFFPAVLLWPMAPRIGFNLVAGTTLFVIFLGLTLHGIIYRGSRAFRFVKEVEALAE